MRNDAQETLLQIALRNYSKEVEGKVSICVIFGEVGVGDMQSRTPRNLSWLSNAGASRKAKPLS